MQHVRSPGVAAPGLGAVNGSLPLAIPQPVRRVSRIRPAITLLTEKRSQRMCATRTILLLTALTIPLTHLVNYIDARLRQGRAVAEPQDPLAQLPQEMV